MREPTPAQKTVAERLRSTFGKDAIRVGSPDAMGWVLIRATCQLGEWHWRFDTDGELRAANLTERLFDMPPQLKRKPTNAQAN